MHGRRLPVALDERVQRVVERSGAVEDGDRLRDAGELRRDRFDAEAPRELGCERLRVGADHDGHLAGEERRGHLLEVLDLGDRAAVDRERLLAEDRGVHAAQERTRLQAQLLDEELAALAVRLERLRLAAGAVEGEHELGAQPLAERMRADERLELADYLRVSSDRKLRLGTLLDEREVELLEPRDLLPRERLVAELRQRLAAPQGAARRRAAPRAAPARSPARRRRGSARARGRAARGRAARGSPAAASRSRPGRAPSAAARRSSGATATAVAGGLLLPQRLDQTVERDDPSRLEQEHGEQRPLLRAAERDRLAFLFASLERAEDGEFDHCAKVVAPRARPLPNGR